MKNQAKRTDRHDRKAPPGEDNPKGYPLYPDKDDIYNKSRKEENLNPDELSSLKESNAKRKDGADATVVLPAEIPGNGLDVPGSELDDALENVGSEDEENNYYSLGGDDHNNLDEDIPG